MADLYKQIQSGFHYGVCLPPLPSIISPEKCMVLSHMSINRSKQVYYIHVHVEIRFTVILLFYTITVDPLNKGHIGDSHFGLCKEVQSILCREVMSSSRRVLYWRLHCITCTCTSKSINLNCPLPKIAPYCTCTNTPTPQWTHPL